MAFDNAVSVTPSRPNIPTTGPSMKQEPSYTCNIMKIAPTSKCNEVKTTARLGDMNCEAWYCNVPLARPTITRCAATSLRKQLYHLIIILNPAQENTGTAAATGYSHVFACKVKK